MKIFYIKDNKLFSVYFDYVLNLQQLESELYELYDFWTYEENEALAYLAYLYGDSDV